MKHISHYLGKAPSSLKASDLRALQIKREAIQTTGNLAALKAIDKQIENLVMGVGK